MRGIEDVEKIFELPFSALAVIQCKQRKRKERAQLNRCIKIGQGYEHDCHGDQGRQTIPAQVVEQDGQKDAERAVVKAEAVILQKVRQPQHKKDDPSEGANKQTAGNGTRFFFERVNAIDDRNRTGEGQKDALHKVARRDGSDELADRTKPEDHAEIACAVFRIEAALSNHKREDWERQPPDHPKDHIAWKKEKTCVVNEHGKHRNDLERIASEPDGKCFLFHFASSFLIRLNVSLYYIIGIAKCQLRTFAVKIHKNDRENHVLLFTFHKKYGIIEV